VFFLFIFLVWVKEGTVVFRFGFAIVLAMGLWACAGDEGKDQTTPETTPTEAAAVPDAPGTEPAGETAVTTATETPATPAEAPATEVKKETAQGTMYVTAEMLNVRGGPSMTAKVLRHVKKGDALQILGKEGKWMRIADGEYVSGKYLTETQTAK
jgi:uncharacterized protein YgiM (DUF1202 family)